MNSIAADPLYVAPTATPADLTLQPTSPCASVGFTLPNVTTDFFLAARTPPVSIGAQEFDSGTTASYVTFGGGCTGSNGVPALQGVGTPRIGNVFAVNLTNLNIASPLAIMLTGLSRTMSPLGPLPLNLTPFGLPGCSAYTSMNLIELIASPSGAAAYQLTIPQVPTLVGMPFYHQGASFDAAANATGLTFSNAGAGVVGI